MGERSEKGRTLFNIYNKTHAHKTQQGDISYQFTYIFQQQFKKILNNAQETNALTLQTATQRWGENAKEQRRKKERSRPPRPHKSSPPKSRTSNPTTRHVAFIGNSMSCNASNLHVPRRHCADVAAILYAWFPLSLCTLEIDHRNSSVVCMHKPSM